MKIAVNIFLFTFIVFLSTPTLISFVDDKTDTSCFFTLCEEEENHSPFNEVKILPTANHSLYDIVIQNEVRFNFLMESKLSYYNLAHQIFSPPPNNL